MGYIRAEEILPTEIVELIQQYVDGTNIYIPRKPQHRQEAYEALELLTLPFRHCYEKRRECYD